MMVRAAAAFSWATVGTRPPYFGTGAHFLDIDMEQKARMPSKRKAATEDASKGSTSGTKNTPKRPTSGTKNNTKRPKTSTSTTESPPRHDTETLRNLYSPIANAIKHSTDTTIKDSMPKFIKSVLQGAGYTNPVNNSILQDDDHPAEHFLFEAGKTMIGFGLPTETTL